MDKLASVLVSLKRGSDASSEIEALSNLENFHHQPLELDKSTIRVLGVFPGLAESIIKCKLWHIDLAEDTHNCLSYTWGTDEHSHGILINDHTFKVRRNLHDFLQQARRLNIEGPLWIDAICINQEDTRERNHQVQQMVDIYRYARRVIVFPGYLPHGLGKLVTGVRAARSQEGVFNFLPWHLRGYGIWLAVFCCPGRMEILREMDALPYWKRTWIIQENMLAKDAVLILGNDMIKRYDLERFVEHLKLLLSNDRVNRSLRLPGSWSFARLMRLPKDKEAMTVSDTIDLLLSVKDSHCSDIRDKVPRYYWNSAFHASPRSQLRRGRSFTHAARST